MSNEQVVKQAIIEETSPELVKVTEGDFQALKLAAQIFIDRVNELSELGISISRIGPLQDQLQAYYTMMRNSTIFTRETLALQHTFESQLNDFLGRTIYLTYVNKEGDLYFYDEVHTRMIYSKATRNRGRGNITKSKMFESYDLERELQEKMRASAAQRADVYREAIKRWEYNSNEDMMNYDPSYHTFYWRLRNNHYIQGWTEPIATRGIIAEGYAKAVINEASDISNSNIEYSLKALWEGPYIYANSVAGILTGDVTFDDAIKVNEYGNIQFAIKSGSFSTANFGQYLRLAYNVVQIKDITLQDFKENFSTLINVNDATIAFIEAANKVAEEKGQEELQNFANKNKIMIKGNI